MSNPPEILTLDEARAFLNFDSGDTDDDEELLSFITAVTSVVEGEVGPVVAREETAILYGNCGLATPAPTSSILSITSGAYLSDESAIDVSKMIVDRGMILQSNGATMPYRPWTITYQAGRGDVADVPEGIKKGALEILKLAWSTQRMTDAPAFLIPYRAAAWFKPYAPKLGFA